MSSVSAIAGEAYPSRIKAIELLRSRDATSEALRAAALEVGRFADRFGRVSGAADWRALGLALETVAFLVDWAGAVEAAEQDADRFLRAARQRLKLFGSEEEPSAYSAAVRDALAPVKQQMEPEDVSALCARLGALPMPVAILADPVPAPWRGSDEERNTKPEELTVAFLEFTINDSPAANLQALRPNEIHDLGLTIRVSRWPQQADVLAITPLSVEPQSAWELPRFTFSRPEGEPPYTFQRDGRMMIRAPQGFDARPLEFLYAAEFSPAVEDERVMVAGQRRLRLDGLGSEGQAISGYGEIDTKIVEARRTLRAHPMIPEGDIRSIMTLLPSLGSLAGAAVQDALYPKPITESEFEIDLRDRLRSVPTIGAELEQQAHAAGGRTDLSFRGVRLELKSERAKRLLPQDCARFVGQAATYAVGSGKRVAILCVLDCSPKKAAPLPLGSCLFLQEHNTGAGIVIVITVLIQGGLPKPSALSR